MFPLPPEIPRMTRERVISESRWTFCLLLLLACHVSSNFLCPSPCRCQDTQVDCSGQDLDIIPDDLDPETTRLDLHGNQLQRIRAGSLRTLPHLVWLDLSSNKIRELEYAFSNLHSLRHLDFSNNELSYISRGILTLDGRSLETLDLSHNSGLTLSEGFFQDLPLRMLTLRHAGLTSLAFLHNATIHSLDLSYNLLAQEVWAALPRMRFIVEVNLESVGLHEVNMTSPIPTLQRLYMPNNHITKIHSRYLHNVNNLTFLDISSNQITQVPLDLDECLRNLSLFNISNNQLKTIHAESIDAMPLQYLGLYDNRLTGLSAAFLPLLAVPGTNDSSGLQLDIRRNPLRCNCELLWLKTWLSTQPNDTVPDAECHVPTTMSLSAARTEDFQCSPPNITEFQHSMPPSEAGAQLLLVCSSAAEPPPWVTMSTPNGDVYTQPPSLTESPTFTSLQASLVLPSCMNIGNYSCSANNSYGSAILMISIQAIVNSSTECASPTQTSHSTPPSGTSSPTSGNSSAPTFGTSSAPSSGTSPAPSSGTPSASTAGLGRHHASSTAVAVAVLLLFLLVSVVIGIVVFIYWRSSGHYDVAKTKVAYNNKAYEVDITIS